MTGNGTSSATGTGVTGPVLTPTASISPAIVSTNAQAKLGVDIAIMVVVAVGALMLGDGFGGLWIGNILLGKCKRMKFSASVAY